MEETEHLCFESGPRTRRFLLLIKMINVFTFMRCALTNYFACNSLIPDPAFNIIYFSLIRPIARC